MKITLPQWKPEYKSRITEHAYNEIAVAAQAELDRALQLYEAYGRTKNDILYEVFDEVLVKLKSKLEILGLTAWSEFQKIGWSLNNAAEVSVYEDGLKSTMLYDLAGVMRG